MRIKLFIGTLMILTLSIFIIQCTSSKEDSKGEKERNKLTAEIPEPAPAPGTAEAVMKILSIAEQGKNFLINAEVLSAGKFGSAVPPIPKGSKLKILLPGNLLTSKDNFSEGSTIKALLSFSDVMESLENTGNWKIVKLIK